MIMIFMIYCTCHCIRHIHQHVQQQLKHINTGTETSCNNNSEYVFGNENDTPQPTIVFNKNDAKMAGNNVVECIFGVNDDENGFACDTDHEISFDMLSFFKILSFVQLNCELHLTRGITFYNVDQSLFVYFYNF